MEPARRGLDAADSTDLVGSYRSMWIAPVVAAVTAALSDAVAMEAVRCRGARFCAVVRFSRHRLVDQPAAARREARLTTRPDVFLRTSPARPGRSSRPTSARTTTGFRPTTIRSIRSREWPIAPRRPTSAWRCSRICPRTTSATAGRAAHRAHGASLRHHGGLERYRAISTTGTTRGRCTAAAALHVVGGQRESRGPPADLARGTAHAAGSADPEVLAYSKGSATHSAF